MKIEFKNVSYTYNKKGPFEVKAVKNINLTINTGEYIGIIGHTGSGKSTLLQMCNGIIKPTEGDVFVDGINTKDEKFIKDKTWQKVGLVFQYPEYQLFEETIAKDIAFGPTNMGLSEEKVRQRVNRAMELVDLKEDMKDKSPFELSGGQQRKVAIAGILAMKPYFLILDEPTAGLDPRSKNELLFEFDRIFRENPIGLVMVSHSMEDIAKIANRLVVMNNGEIIMDDIPRNIFNNIDMIKEIGLDVPKMWELVSKLNKKGIYFENNNILTIKEAYNEIEKYLRRKEC